MQRDLICIGNNVLILLVSCICGNSHAIFRNKRYRSCVFVYLFLFCLYHVIHCDAISVYFFFCFLFFFFFLIIYLIFFFFFFFFNVPISDSARFASKSGWSDTTEVTQTVYLYVITNNACIFYLLCCFIFFFFFFLSIKPLPSSTRCIFFAAFIPSHLWQLRSKFPACCACLRVILISNLLKRSRHIHSPLNVQAISSRFCLFAKS